MKTYNWLKQNRLLSHLPTTFCALTIVGASLALPSAEADRPPPNANGGFIPCFNILNPATDIQQAGPNTIITFNVTAALTDTLNGSTTGTERDVIHPDGYITFEGTLVFNGSVDGRSGTFLATYTGEGNANPTESVHGLLPGEENAQFVGDHGTDDLAGLHAHGTFHGFLGTPMNGCAFSGQGEYSGYILFAP